MSVGLLGLLESLKGKYCAVIGMGVSNTPLIKLLLENGTRVRICDKKTDHDPETVKAFETLGAEFSFGENYLADLKATDYIFKTPGIRYDVPELLEAEACGSVITSEMEQFLRLCSCRTVGITGSDGKTTTTTIIGKLIEQAGRRCFVGGNIGKPLLPEVDTMNSDDFAVIELSSFQLMNIQFSPEISVITNVTPNHLDVHKSFKEYCEAKEEIFRHSSGKVVLNYDNDVTRAIAEKLGDRAVLFSSKEIIPDGYCIEDGYIVKRSCGQSEKIISVADIKIPGLHNVENYMAAIAATDGIVSKEDILHVAKNFGGVEHRMEFVRELRGVKYYNDSIASSPTRTIAGLRAFNKKVILIAGGYDKKIPFDVLGDAAKEYVKTLILVGATSEKIKAAVCNTAGYDEKTLPIIMCDSFEDAVKTSQDVAKAGDIVTLSPACASFDLFKNFMERGDKFKELVNLLS